MPPLVFRPGSAIPQRLPNPVRSRGHGTGLSTPGGFVFGGVFAAIGTFVTLIGLRVIEPGGRLNVPHWVLLPIGLVFASVGAFLSGKTWLRLRAERRHDQLILRHPDQPALADYEWDPAGSRSDLRQQATRATVIAAFFVLFLTPVNYIAFKEAPEFAWVLRVIVGLFDLVTLYLLGDMALRWGRVFKFGNALLRFGQFPLLINQPVRLTWIAPEGCRGDATGGFTLRAIREWYETSGRGNSRSTRLVHEQQWSASWEIPSTTFIRPGDTYDLALDLPPDAPGTALRAERPLFWELEVNLALPGLDFKDTYLVPIYSRKPLAPPPSNP